MGNVRIVLIRILDVDMMAADFMCKYLTLYNIMAVLHHLESLSYIHLFYQPGPYILFLEYFVDCIRKSVAHEYNSVHYCI